jgi:hypothetical protein
MHRTNPQHPAGQGKTDALFALMEQAIRQNGQYAASDLLYMLADLTPTSPDLAAAIGRHAADFIQGDGCTEDTPWTDIVVEAYRRALFDAEKSPLYGTGYFFVDGAANHAAMESFVTDYITRHTMGSDGGGGDGTATRYAPHVH